MKEFHKKEKSCVTLINNINIRLTESQFNTLRHLHMKICCDKFQSRESRFFIPQRSYINKQGA